MRCPNCHRDWPDQTKFCGGCGTKLGSVIAPAAEKEDPKLGVLAKAEAPAAHPDDQPAAAPPDATQLAPPPSRGDGDQEAETRLADAHAEGAAQAAPEEQAIPAEWNVDDVILDLYEVKQIHEGGGMGLVYRVHHRDWNTDLALKSPRAEAFETEAQRENFIRECETWIELGMHPHIVSCFYVRAIGDVPHVFAEYVEGGSLEEWIEERRLYEGGPDEALGRMLDIAIQFAWGLHYAHEHEQGLIHQDVKPANVMVTPEGEAKVTDFGLARARAAAGGLTAEAEEGQTILVSSGGMTPAYCSPEQAEGKELSRKTDIWSWGLSVLQMFTGGRTWRSGTIAAEALEEYRKTGAAEESIPLMPEAVAELLKECFQRDPQDRPESFHEIAGRLRTVYEQPKGEAYPREEPKAAELLADGLNNRALSMLDLGNSDEAERLFDDALKADPHHLEATYNFGLIRWRQGRLTDVDLVQQLERVRSSHESTWIDEYQLAQVHLERGDVESAHKLLEEAAQQAPDVPEVQDALRVARSGSVPVSSCIRIFGEHSGPVYAICLSGDGCWALSGSKERAPLEEEGRVRLWEIATGQCMGTFEFKRPHGCLCPSADGRWALLCHDRLELWDVTTRQCVRSFEGSGRAHAICLSGDGRWALSGHGPWSGPQTLRLWEVETGRCVRSFEGHGASDTGPSGVRSVCMSEDGHWALSGSEDNTLCFWDVSTGECVRMLEGHTDTVLSVSMSKDGRWALSGSKDKTARLWEAATGRCVRTFDGHTGHVNSVYLSGDGSLALSADGSLRLWEVATGRCLRTFEGFGGGFSVSVDGRRALSRGPDKTLRLWELAHEPVVVCSPRPSRPRSYKEMRQAETQVSDMLRSAAKSLDEARFADALNKARQVRGVPGWERRHETREMWNRLSLACPKVSVSACWHARSFEGHTGNVYSTRLSGDGRWALSTGNQQCALWEVETGRCVRSFEDPLLARFGCLSGDGRWALLGGGRRLRLWEASTGRCLRTCDRLRVDLNCLSLSEDGRWALSGPFNQLWDLATGHCVRTFKGQQGTVKSVCLSRDGQWALSGSEQVSAGFGITPSGESREMTVCLWETATGQCVRTFKGHTGQVNSVSLTKDARWAISGSSDKTIRLWEIATGWCLRSFEGHGGGVTSVCVSEDGNWILSGSSDKTIRLWNVPTGRCEKALEGHTLAVHSVFLTKDGRWMLSGSRDNTIRLWEFDWELEAREVGDWDKGARPYLEIFLTLHTPYASDDPTTPEGLTRRGRPSWTENDFQGLIRDLQYAGYGWLRPEGVKRELEKMAVDWEGPPPLPGE